MDDINSSIGAWGFCEQTACRGTFLPWPLPSSLLATLFHRHPWVSSQRTSLRPAFVAAHTQSQRHKLPKATPAMKRGSCWCTSFLKQATAHPVLRLGINVQGGRNGLDGYWREWVCRLRKEGGHAHRDRWWTCRVWGDRIKFRGIIFWWFYTWVKARKTVLHS